MSLMAGGSKALNSQAEQPSLPDPMLQLQDSMHMSDPEEQKAIRKKGKKTTKGKRVKGKKQVSGLSPWGSDDKEHELEFNKSCTLPR